MQITDSNFETTVLKSDRPVLVDFWASWCPPCKMMQPLVDRLHDELKDTADIVSINIDQNPNTAAEYKIQEFRHSSPFRTVRKSSEERGL